MTRTILLTILGLASITLLIVFLSFDKPRVGVAYDPIKYYNRSGLVSPITKIYNDTFNVNSASGSSVDITPAGFASIKSCNAVAIRNTATSTSCPNVAIKTMSTSAIVLNITEGNSSLVNVLGNNVLLGPSTAFANTSGLLVAVTVFGN